MTFPFMPKPYEIKSDVQTCHCMRRFIKICTRQKECPKCTTPDEFRILLIAFDMEHNQQFKHEKVNRNKILPTHISGPKNKEEKV